jgi:hypothetical protein
MEYSAKQYRRRSLTEYRLANLSVELVRRRKWRRCFRCNRYYVGPNSRPWGFGVAHFSCVGHRGSLGNACRSICPLMIAIAFNAISYLPKFSWKYFLSLFASKSLINTSSRKTSFSPLSNLGLCTHIFNAAGLPFDSG